MTYRYGLLRKGNAWALVDLTYTFGRDCTISEQFLRTCIFVLSSYLELE
jgi:hypothetical protein